MHIDNKGKYQVMNEYECVEVGHHKNIAAVTRDYLSKGWKLHSYQATGWGADVKHYLLFEKGTD